MRGYAKALSQGTLPGRPRALSISRASTCRCVSVSRGGPALSGACWFEACLCLLTPLPVFLIELLWVFTINLSLIKARGFHKHISLQKGLVPYIWPQGNRKFLLFRIPWPDSVLPQSRQVEGRAHWFAKCQ